MGGSGGGSIYSTGEPARLRGELDEQAERAELDAQVNKLLTDTLAELNQRDAKKIRAYLDEIKEALSGQVEDVEALLFGGSVAKHTYVDGLSDIDSLVVVGAAPGTTPAQLREAFAEALRSTLGDNARNVVVGDLAVTVTYPDGTVIQLLPALRQGEGFAISSPKGAGWSHIEPKRFTERITELNKSMLGMAAPVIKLAKSTLGGLPQEQRLSGYHVEALAIAAFESYNGPKTPKEMLTHFFRTAADNIKRPIHDVTGQSSAVDDYLGNSGSADRERASAQLARIARRMESARSRQEWDSIVNPDEPS